MLKRPLHLGLTLLVSQNIFNNVTWVSLIYTPILNYSQYENGSVLCDNFQSFPRSQRARHRWICEELVLSF